MSSSSSCEEIISTRKRKQCIHKSDFIITENNQYFNLQTAVIPVILALHTKKVKIRVNHHPVSKRLKKIMKVCQVHVSKS